MPTISNSDFMVYEETAPRGAVLPHIFNSQAEFLTWRKSNPTLRILDRSSVRGRPQHRGFDHRNEFIAADDTNIQASSFPQDKEPLPMTAQPLPLSKPSDRMSPEELRAELETLKRGMAEILKQIIILQSQPQAAPAQAAPAPAAGSSCTGYMKPGNYYQDIKATEISWGISEQTHKDTFRVRGFPFVKHGVVIYPEALADLGYTTEQVAQKRTIAISTWVRIEMTPKQDVEGFTPRKVIGLGDGTMQSPTLHTPTGNIIASTKPTVRPAPKPQPEPKYIPCADEGDPIPF